MYVKGEPCITSFFKLLFFNSYGNFLAIRFANGRVSLEICQDMNGLNYAAMASTDGVRLDDSHWHQMIITRAGTLKRNAWYFEEGRLVL